MKVLVINPPSSDNWYINRDQMGGMGQKISFGIDFKTRLLSHFKCQFIHLPVMQLVYAATILDQEHDVLFIDALNDDMNLDQVLSKIKSFSPDYVFMAVSSSEILFERDVVAKKIKEIVPNCKVITIGDMVTTLPELIKEPFDMGIMGEVEKTVKEICIGKELSEIKGIIYHKDGKPIVNPKQDLLTGEEQEKLPFPNWSLLNYKRFTYYPLILKKPVAIMLSSRGCPFSCAYCSYAQNMGVKWRARSAESIVQEMESNVKKYGFKGISIRDPLFTFSKQRALDIANLMIEKKLKVSWTFETRPELLDKELLDILYKAGCSGINMGIESITPSVLKNVGRVAIPLEKIKEVVQYAEKIGIRTTCFFMFGLPGSSRKTIQDIIDFALELNPSHAEYKIATPFPGTRLYDQARENGWITSEKYEDLGGYSSTMKISDELDSAYLEKAGSDAFKKFYLRKSYFFRELKRGDLFAKSYIFLSNFFSAFRKSF